MTPGSATLVAEEFHVVADKSVSREKNVPPLFAHTCLSVSVVRKSPNGSVQSGMKDFATSGVVRAASILSEENELRFSLLEFEQVTRSDCEMGGG
jgi:hypothetical protein